MSTSLPSQMMQIVISEHGGPEVLRPHEASLPKCGLRDVLVKVEAAGVNRPDVLQRQGMYPMPPGVTTIPGLEIAGRVVALGEEVTEFAIGDPVCGLTNGGGYAEYCLLPVGQALPVPQGLTMSQAAAIPETFFTVWANVFQPGFLASGDTLLVHGGASGIGTTALMLGKAFGLKTFATAGSDIKCHALERLGAIAINYRDCDFSSVIDKSTDGKGVDAILDIVGGRYFNANINALAQDGRLVIIGFIGGRYAEKADLQALMLKRAVVTGSTMRSRTSEEKAAIAVQLKNEVWPLIEKGSIAPLVHAEFPLAEAANAHQMMEADEHIGKIVLKTV